jgi:hypothetical protein
MSCRTVPGTLSFYESYNRTVPGTEFSERSVDGRFIGIALGLQGTEPTITEISTGSGNYTTPQDCVYIEVYLQGPGGGGAGGAVSTSHRNGGGGGAGGCAFGFFEPGTYSYSVASEGSGGAAGANGLTGGLARFGIMTALGGEGGIARGAGTATFAAASGTTTNSLIHIGSSTAMPPGRAGGNGGANFIKAYGGAASVSETVDIQGGQGLTGGGGSGACGGIEAGGDGGIGSILIIEYY